MEWIRKNIDKERFDRIRWVCLARGRDPSNGPLLYFRVEKGYSACTDGHRLHIVHDTLGLKDGYYMVEKYTATQAMLEKAAYTVIGPDVEPVMVSPRERMNDKETTVINFTGEVEEALEEVQEILKKEGLSIDPKYFKETMSAMVPFTIFIGKEIRTAVHFVHDVHEALVMPRIIKQEEVKDGKSGKQGVGKDRPEPARGKPAGNSVT